MAEGLAKAILAKKNPQIDIEIQSAGTFACPNAPAAWQAIETLKQKGINIENHSATLLTKELVDKADIVLTMTNAHRQQVLQLTPDAEHKVFTLGDYVGVAGDIPDPVGQPLEVYQECAAHLETLINKALTKILEEHEGKTQEMENH